MYPSEEKRTTRDSPPHILPHLDGDRSPHPSSKEKIHKISKEQKAASCFKKKTKSTRHSTTYRPIYILVTYEVYRGREKDQI